MNISYMLRKQDWPSISHLSLVKLQLFSYSSWFKHLHSSPAFDGPRNWIFPERTNILFGFISSLSRVSQVNTWSKTKPFGPMIVLKVIHPSDKTHPLLAHWKASSRYISLTNKQKTKDTRILLFLLQINLNKKSCRILYNQQETFI